MIGRWIVTGRWMTKTRRQLNDRPCPECGTRNPAQSQFCISCGAYLGWSDELTGVVPAAPRGPGPVPPPGPQPPPGMLPGSRQGTPPTAPMQAPGGPAQQPWGAPTGGSGHYGWESVPRAGSGGVPVQPQSPPTLPPGAPVQSSSLPADDSDLRVELEQQGQLVVTPGGGPGAVVLHLANTSTVVEAYQINAVMAPPWLQVAPGQARLLPGTDERVPVSLTIPAEQLVAVQRVRVVLRVQGESSQRLVRDVPLEVIVGEVTAPAVLRLEPSNVRVRDETTTTLRVLIDNRRSNVPITFDLAGRDPEQEVHFAFQPPQLTVPPGGSSAAGLRIDAPLPAAGEQVNRTLTISATGGGQELLATGGFSQVSSALVIDPPVGVRLDPSVVHGERKPAVSQIIVDNRRGSRPQRIRLEARDTENNVQFTIQPQDLVVPPGQYAAARLTMRAPRPAAGESVTRSLIVAAWDGQQSIETQGQLVQYTATQRPFLRLLLTLLGSLGMIFGALLPWTIDPSLSGLRWNYPNVSTFFELPTGPVDETLSTLGATELVSSVVSLGGILLLLGVLAAIGIFATTGKMIRTVASLGILVLVGFLAVLIVRLAMSRGFPALDVGWGLALVGCVLAFIGSFFARP